MKAPQIIAQIILFVSLTFGSSAQSQFRDGLVGFYPFNGTANDESGNTNNGNPGTAQLVADRFGKLNSAYFFNDSDSVITFSKPPTTNTENISMFCWVRPASLPQAGMAVTLGYGDGNSIATCNGYTLGIEGTSYNVANSCIAWITAGPTFNSTNDWKHLGLVREAGKDFLYVNGTLVKTETIGSPGAPTSFGIGYLIGDGNPRYYFHGSIDEVRVYNRAVSSNEISQLYSYESTYCSPHAARATGTVVNGFLVAAQLADPGCGYTNPPVVIIQGGGGSNATATAEILDGSVVAIHIVNAGCCYTTPPRILIASPPFEPTLSIAVSRVKVTQNVVLGRNYILEGSTNAVTWQAVGPKFTATEENIETELEVSLNERFFRIKEVP
jgi:hypothetical protein